MLASEGDSFVKLFSSFSLNLPKVKEAKPNTSICNNPSNVHKLLADITDLAQEAFCVLTLNTKYKLIDRHLITLGLLNSTLVHPREVFKPAILDSAASIILAHNHPSGDVSPSQDDLQITRKLIEASKIIEIDILDHIIVAKGATPYFSIRESGMVGFQ